MRVKPGQEALIIVDDVALPRRLAEAFSDAVTQLGAEPVVGVMPARQMAGQEPPKSLAAAMLAADVVLTIHDRVSIGHTNARKQATGMGKSVYLMYTDMGEDYFARDFSLEDWVAIGERSEALAKRFNEANTARLTTPLGTDLTVDLSGRSAVPIYALNPVTAGVPDYGEVAICPVEDKANGTIVIDSHLAGWGYLLREPLRVRVQAGRCVEVEGDSEDAARLRDIVFAGDNADNCPAEFAIGTSHTIPSSQRGTSWSKGRCGWVHVAFGRNNDIGGTLWSKIHMDAIISRGTITLDGDTVLKDGQLLI